MYVSELKAALEAMPDGALVAIQVGVDDETLTIARPTSVELVEDSNNEPEVCILASAV